MAISDSGVLQSPLEAFRATHHGHPSLRDGDLDLVDRARVSLLPWRGQFSPELIERLLAASCHDVKTVLDPFMGSGTVLFEAARLGLNAIGSEINPAAAILARTAELVGLPKSEYTALNRNCTELLRSLDSHPLAKIKGLDLAQALEEAGPLEQIALEAAFLLAAKKTDLAPSSVLITQVATLITTVASLSAATRRRPRLSVLAADARDLPLMNSAVDQVITSPPYVNVFNYHQQYRAATESLGYRPLQCATSEIGANRKHRGNRVLTVIQYCMDMAQVLNEMARVLRSQGQFILVIGRESNVRKTPFKNTEFVGALAMASPAFELEHRFERSFTSRFGTRVFEDLLFLRRVEAPPTDELIEVGRSVAVESLQETLGSITDPGIMSDVCAALDRAPSVMPSPFYGDTGQRVSPQKGPPSIAKRRP